MVKIIDSIKHINGLVGGWKIKIISDTLCEDCFRRPRKAIIIKFLFLFLFSGALRAICLRGGYAVTAR